MHAKQLEDAIKESFDYLNKLLSVHVEDYNNMSAHEYGYKIYNSVKNISFIEEHMNNLPTESGLMLEVLMPAIGNYHEGEFHGEVLGWWAGIMAQSSTDDMINFLSSITNYYNKNIKGKLEVYLQGQNPIIHDEL